VTPIVPVAGIQTETPAVAPPAVADTGAGHRQTPATPAPAVPAAPQRAANVPITPDASRAAPPPPPPPDTAELSTSTGPARAQDTALLVANSDRPAEALAAATSVRPDMARETSPRKPGTIAKASAPNAKPGAAQASPSTMSANATAEVGAPAPTAQAQNRLADLAASFAAMSINHPVGGASKFSASPVFIDSLPINGIAPVGVGEPGGVSTLAPATAASARAAAMAAPVVQQVAVRISQAVRDGANRITVQLHPADLGRIEVKLELGDSGRLSATVVVDRPETLDMMQRDARGLERALQQAGLDADSDSLQFSLRDGGDDAENAESDGLGDDPGQTAGPDDDRDDSGEITLAQGVTTMLQADGGLDIRV
jgi:flagellar hook-length control protein FliK